MHSVKDSCLALPRPRAIRDMLYCMIEQRAMGDEMDASLDD